MQHAEPPAEYAPLPITLMKNVAEYAPLPITLMNFNIIWENTVCTFGLQLVLRSSLKSRKFSKQKQQDIHMVNKFQFMSSFESGFI